MRARARVCVGVFVYVWGVGGVLTNSTPSCEATPSDQTTRCVTRCVMPRLHSQVKELALLAVGNIAGDGPAARDAVLAAGAMQRVVHILETEFRLSIVRRVSATLARCVGGC